MKPQQLTTNTGRFPNQEADPCRIIWLFAFDLFHQHFFCLCALAEKTVKLNDFTNFSVVNCRLQELSERYRERFSLVLCNPPYERVGTGFDNAEYEKAICRKELTLTLPEIAQAAAKALKFGGRLCMVHRADRLAEICYVLKGYNLEVKRLQFVTGREGATPYLLLIEAVKGGKPATELLPTLINAR